MKTRIILHCQCISRHGFSLRNNGIHFILFHIRGIVRELSLSKIPVQIDNLILAYLFPL